MKIDSLNNETIRGYIPNVFADVEGETPLCEKLLPWIRSAKAWMEAEFIGPDDWLPDSLNDAAVEIVVRKALADAIPSLDIVLTPNGFGIVSSDAVAPASKERIERLMNSCSQWVENQLELFLEKLYQFDEWHDCERGKYFSATFMQQYRDWKKTQFDSFDLMRGEALRIEKILAEKYLGHNLMDAVRDKYSHRKPFAPPFLALDIRTAVKDIMDGIKYKYDQNACWHAAQPILVQIKRHPEYREIWKAEMEHIFKSDFNNTRPGAIFF